MNNVHVLGAFMNKNKTLKLTFSGLCLALCMVLPFITGQIPTIGNVLSPMHIPVLICGFWCGPLYGISVGFIAPYLRFLLFGMPKLVPSAIGMSFELATYGFMTGLLFRKLKRNTFNIYVSLITSMFVGRIVWGIARFVIAQVMELKFPLSVFIADGFVKAIPGIILHIIIIPLVVRYLIKQNAILD